MDFVLTVCDSAAGETCPVWPGQPMTAHWGVPDPAAVAGTDEVRRKAFADASRTLQSRIRAFVSLPVDSLDRLSLKRRLDDIGLDGMELIEEIRLIYDNYAFDTEILAASVRTALHVKQVALIGADVATCPPAVIKGLVKHPLTDKGIEQFLADWKKTGQSL